MGKNLGADRRRGDTENSEVGSAQSALVDASVREEVEVGARPNREGVQPPEEDVTLSFLLDVCEPSARLRRMLIQTRLGTTTIREYESDHSAIEAWMLCQPNCGRRSVTELRELLALQWPQLSISPLSVEPEASVEKLVAHLTELAPAMLDQPLVEVVPLETLSVRLKRMLRDTELRSTTMRRFLVSRQEVELKMLRERNCGSRTIRELQKVIANRIGVELSRLGGSQAEWSEVIQQSVDAVPSKAADESAPPDDASIRDIVSWHLSKVPDRTATILRFRFGIDCDPKTLAEIGEMYSVTRERIRQIEAKALKRMKMVHKRHPCTPQMEVAHSEFISSIFGEKTHVADETIDQALRGLDGSLSMLIELAGLTPKEWFAMSAVKLGHGWLRPNVDVESVKSRAIELEHSHGRRPFPRAASEFFRGGTDDLTTAAAELVLGWHLENSYFFDVRPRVRLLRTTALHSILSARAGPTELAELLSHYTGAVPDDQCSDRDLVIVMEAAPHLFIETLEGYWAALGAGGEPPRPSAKPSVEVEHSSGEPDDATIAHSLEAELERTGPLRVSQLINRAIDIIPEGRSANSVGPTLLLHPSRFIRVLPGVYALPHQVLDDRSLAQAQDLDYLLNVQQARLFALARRAGEQWGAYPLWTIRAEMRICRWARSEGLDDLLRSLLSVASIEDWPTDELDRETWFELKDRHARFELAFDPRVRHYEIPLDRVLAASIHAREFGALGWMTANRILGYGPDGSAAAPLLAGMVKAGFLSAPPCGSWQLPHSIGARLNEWIDRLESELHTVGELRWNGRTGAELSEAFDQGISSSVEEDHLPETEADEFELMMAEHRRSLQARRQEALVEMAQER